MSDELPPLPEHFFSRQDDAPDEDFYSIPRIVTHIDDATVDAVTDFYRQALAPSDRILDLMSSWISYLPPETAYHEVVGLGMNQEELDQNGRLDKRVVHNLNSSPTMPFEDGSFDKVMIIVSIQYLVRPFEVFSDIARILGSGGQCIVALSHRLFPTKAIYAFQVLGPADRCQLVMHYMDQTREFIDPELIDRSPQDADPLWIVRATRR